MSAVQSSTCTDIIHYAILFVEVLTQECIPVGCVPAAHWPYAAVYFRGGGLLSALGGGVSVPRGCLLPGGVCSRGCLLWGGGWLLWGGSAPGGVGVCSRGCIPACTEADTLTPVDRILDTCLWKYYLGQTSLRPVITMPETKKPIRQFAKTRFELIASNVTFF